MSLKLPRVSSPANRRRSVVVAFAVAGICALSLLAPQPVSAVTYTVTTLSGDDTVVGSLPKLVADAVDGDIIDFQAGLTGTIDLDGVLLIDKNLSIVGPGSADIEITTTSGTIISVLPTKTLTISGLELSDSSGGAAVRLNGSGASSFTNMLFSDNSAGIVATGSGGAGLTVIDSTFSGTNGLAIDASDTSPVVVGGTTGTVIDNGGSATPFGNGIFVDDAASATFTNLDVSGVDIGLRVFGDSDDQTAENVSVSDSVFDANTGGIRVAATHGTLDVSDTMITNTVSGGTGSGRALSTSGGVGQVTLDTVTVTGSANSPIQVTDASGVDATDLAVTNNPGGSASFSQISGDVSISGGNFDNSGGRGISVSSTTGTTTLTSVTASDNTDEGVQIFSSGPVTVSGTTLFDGNGAEGLDLQSIGAVQITDVTSTDNAVGVAVSGAGDVSASGSTIDDNGTGIRITGAVGNIMLTDNLVRDNTNTAISVLRQGTTPSTATTSITDSTITGNGGDALQFSDFPLQAANKVTGVWTVGASTVSNNADGALIRALESTVVFDDVTMNENPVAIDLSGAGGVTVVDSDFTGHTGRALDLVDAGVVSITRTDIENDGTANHVGLGVFISGLDSLAIDDLSMTQQAGGMQVVGDNDDQTTEPITIANSAFTGNGGAVTLQRTHGLVSISDTTSSMNAGTGIRVESAGAVTLDTIISNANTSRAVDIDGAASVSATGLTATSNAGITIADVAGNASLTTGTVAGTSGTGIAFSDVTGVASVEGFNVSGFPISGIGASGTNGGVTIIDTVVTGNQRGVVLGGPGVVSVTNLDASTNASVGLSTAQAASVSIIGSTFDSITAGAGVEDGPGLLISDTTGAVVVTGSNARNNAAEGIEIAGSIGATPAATVTIDDTVITGNGGEGVEFRNVGGPLVIDGATIENNPIGVLGVSSAAVSILDTPISGHTGRAIDVSDSGAVTLTDVTIDEGSSLINAGLGVSLVRNDSTTINTSSITNQAVAGLTITHNRTASPPDTVTITSTTVSSNTGAGISISDALGVVSITGTSAASSNGGSGLSIDEAGPVTINGFTADANDGVGIGVTDFVSLDMLASSASNNEASGLGASSGGRVSVTTGSFDGNGTGTGSISDGIALLNLTGDVTLTSVTANANPGDGIEVGAVGNPIQQAAASALFGDVAITGTSSTSNNGAEGVRINFVRDGVPAFTGPNVAIGGITSKSNGLRGLVVSNPQDLSVTGSDFDQNPFGGAQVRSAIGEVEITGSSFDMTGGTGLTVTSPITPTASSILLDAVSIDDNAKSGATLSTSGELTIRNGSSVSRNGNQVTPDTFDHGLSANAATARLVDSAFDGNARHGANVESSTNLITRSSTFDDNGERGIDMGAFTTIDIDGGSLSQNGEYGAFLGDPSSLIPTGSVVVKNLEVVDNPDGLRVNKPSSVNIAGSNFEGHTQWPILISSGAVTIDGVTVGNGPASVPQGNGISISGAASVAVNDLDVGDQDGPGLSIRTVSGPVSLTGSTIGSNGNGVELNDVAGTTTVSTSSLSANRENGLSATGGGAVTFSEVTSNGNGAAGIRLVQTGAVQLADVVADSNVSSGISIESTTGAVATSGGSVTRNGTDGIRVINAVGPTSLSGLDASANVNSGIEIRASGDVSIETATAAGNPTTGISITDAGQVSLAQIMVADSGGSGLRISSASSVSMTRVSIDRSAGNSPSAGEGAELSDIDGFVTIRRSQFRSNRGAGLDVQTATGAVTIDDSTFSLNGGDGAELGTPDVAIGNVSMNGSVFVDNGLAGLDVHDAGDVNLEAVESERNYLASGIGGASPPSTSDAGGVSVRSASEFTSVGVKVVGNGGTGISIRAAGATSITGGTIASNEAAGLHILDSDALTIVNVVIEKNGGIGASLSQATTVSLDGVTVRENTVQGMSIGSATGRIDITGSTFSDHTDTALSISSSAGPVAVTGSSFERSRVSANISNIGGSTRFAQTTFIPAGLNTVGIRSNDLGGLVVVDVMFADFSTAVTSRNITGDVSIESSTFTRATSDALVLTDMVGNFSLIGSSFTDNRAGLSLANVDGTATIDRSTFSGSGGVGALVEFPLHVVEVGNVTGGLDIVTSSFFDNEIANVVDATSTTITVRHSTFVDNSIDSPIRTDAAIDIDHSIVLPVFDASIFRPASSVDLVTPTGGVAPTGTGRFSVIGIGVPFGDTSIQVNDAQLAPAALDGGTTLSRAPLPTSPAIDAGSPDISGAPATDQTGRQRIVDVIDIGAVEFVVVPEPPDPDPDPPAQAALFEPLAPARFADTRAGGETIDDLFEADGKLADGGEYRVRIGGRGQVPADAEGVVMNITTIGVNGTGFVTAHPCVTPRPLASSLNYTAGVNLGNEIVAGLSADGEICLFTSRGAHITVDVTGFVPAGSAVTPITPIRFMDTRPGQNTFDGVGAPGAKLAGGSNTTLLVGSRGQVPLDIAAVIVNVTAIAAEGSGFVTVHPCLDPPPLASSLNYVAGVNRGNELVASVDAAGQICLFTSAATHLAVDVVGYVPKGTTLKDVNPGRLLDTRAGQVSVDGLGLGAGKVEAGGSITVAVGGRGGVPADARAAIVNVTAIGPESVGFVTVHPCVEPRPNASSLNYVPGVNGGNEIIALLDAQGRICLFSSARTHLAVDVVGYLE